MVVGGLKEVFQYIDTYQERMVEDLREAVAIRSVSGSYEHNPHIQRMVKWVEAWLIRLKATTSERFDIGSYSVEGKTIKLPTVILASFGKDLKKKTICVYCRFDVKNADAEQWTTDDPWKLELKNGFLIGRGACKGKMTMLSWFHIIEAFNEQKVPLPVNLKFIIEGMFEMNCFGLEDFLYTQRITFLKNIDYICVNESEWLNSTIPCISYGTCGICQYDVVVSLSGGGGEGGGGGGDGGDGEGELSESEQLLNYIFENCVDNLGNILIPKINDDVVQINPEIEQSLELVECDLTLIKRNLPFYMHNWNKQKILIRMWQMPALITQESRPVSCTCEGEGGGGGGGGGDGAVGRKFVLKIVPVQTPDRCNRFVMDHIGNLMRARFNGPNMKVDCKVKGNRLLCRITDGSSEKAVVSCATISETRAWQENSVSPHYEATKRATGIVFKDPPSLIKESIDSTIILILDKLVHKNTVLLPLCNNLMDENFANECVARITYFEGKKLLGAYMSEVGALK